VPLRRGLTRLLGRPVGQSGSGPTHWALYPSRSEAEAAAAVVRDALARGDLAAPGDRPPLVTAATIIGDAEVTTGDVARPEPPAGTAGLSS
jgi:hypothetical protein